MAAKAKEMTPLLNTNVQKLASACAMLNDYLHEDAAKPIVRKQV
jgi:hypothetical protein